MELANLKELEETATFAVKEAGKFLKENLGKSVHIDRKSSPIDLVTKYDRQSEAKIVNIIQDQYPEHDILAEERPPAKKSSPYKWIIDPLDGTTNYAHGYPIFSVSIGIMHLDQIILGVVYNPITEELFRASQGDKTTLNGDVIRVSKVDNLKDSLLATGFPYDLEKMDKNLKLFEAFVYEAQGIRRAGSAALDLCSVACGRLDGFWEFDLGAWDLAAGSIIAKNAGGKLSDFQGQTLNIFKGAVLASNGLIHQSMLEVLSPGQK